MTQARVELEAAIAQLLGDVAEGERTVEEQRAGYEKFGDLMPLADSVDVSTTSLNGIPTTLVRAEGASATNTILYFHGGGYVIGGFRSHQGFLGALSELASATVALVDYRLAPEDPAPAAVMDGADAYAGLLDGGVAPAQVIISGDSAGGGLSLAVLLEIRNRGLPMPAAAALFSPWTDLSFTGESLKTNAAIDTMVAEPFIRIMAGQYIGAGDPTNPLISPVYGSLEGFPPLLIFCGTDEILLDDSRRIAEAAEALGIPVIFKAWDRMLHVFPTYAPLLPKDHLAWQAVNEVASFAQERFASSSA